MKYRRVWIAALALPPGRTQSCVNVLVRDDYGDRRFVMEPEDVRPRRPRKKRQVKK